MNFFQTLAGEPILLFSLIIILGLILGSFFNVVIYRLPIMMIQAWKKECQEINHLSIPLENNFSLFNLSLPRSHCPHCQRSLAIWHNIPLVSFLLLKGKCAYCKTTISFFYPLVESLTALMGIFIIGYYGMSYQALALAIFSALLILLTFIDIKHQLLPDSLTLSLLWVGLFVSLFHLFTSPENSILGALIGYISLWLFAFIYKLITQKEGMGHGDFKLFAAIGAWVGWQALPLVLFIAAIVGSCVGLFLILLKKHQAHIPIPFGPFLAIAGWIGLIGGQAITDYYIHLLMS